MIPGSEFGFALILVGIVPGGRQSPSESLKVEVSSGDSSSSCSEDGLTYSARLSVRVRVVNSSAATIILARRFEPAPWYKLAASIDDATHGTFIREFSGHEYWPGDWQAPEFGRQPDDARFELVPPAAAAERVVEVYVLSTHAPGGINGFATAGETYILLTGIRTWPYLPMSDKATQRVAWRWRSKGRLVVEDLQLPFVAVTIPSQGRCGTK